MVVAEPVLEAARTRTLGRYDLIVDLDLKLRKVKRRKQDYRSRVTGRRSRSNCLAAGEDHQRCQHRGHQRVVRAHPHTPAHLR
jgi:hypothetical protein